MSLQDLVPSGSEVKESLTRAIRVAPWSDPTRPTENIVRKRPDEEHDLRSGRRKEGEGWARLTHVETGAGRLEVDGPGVSLLFIHVSALMTG